MKQGDVALHFTLAFGFMPVSWDFTLPCLAIHTLRLNLTMMKTSKSRSNNFFGFCPCLWQICIILNGKDVIIIALTGVLPLHCFVLECTSKNICFTYIYNTQLLTMESCACCANHSYGSLTIWLALHNLHSHIGDFECH